MYLGRVEQDEPSSFLHLPGAEEVHLLELLEGVESVLRELLFVLSNVVHADGLEIVNGRAEPDGIGDIGSAGLKAHR